MPAVVAFAVLAVALIHGQDPGQIRTALYPYPLSAVDQGLMPAQELPPAREAAFASRDRAGRRGVSYAPGRVIVKFRDGTSSAVRLSSLGRLTARSAVSERPSYANFDVVSIDPNADAEAAADALSQRPEVEYAQAVYRVHKMFVPNDQFYSCAARGQCQWNLPLIDMERAWDIQGTAGSSITVAVLDSGIAFENKVIRFNGLAFTDDRGDVHPGLGTVDIPFAAAPDLFAPGRFVAPHDFIWNDDDPVDLDSHGTHVSGTIGQLTNNASGTAGVAFNVKLMPVKVVASDWDLIFGSPDQGTDGTLARGLRYAADNGAKIINMSIAARPETCGAAIDVP